MAATHLIACAILERYHHIPVFLHPEGIIAYLTILLLNLSGLFRAIALPIFYQENGYKWVVGHLKFEALRREYVIA